MDDRVKKLKTPEQCESFEKNALRGKRPDLAAEARQRSIQLRAENYGATNQAERECLEAVFAYERVLSEKNGVVVRFVQIVAVSETSISLINHLAEGFPRASRVE